MVHDCTHTIVWLVVSNTFMGDAWLQEVADANGQQATQTQEAIWVRKWFPFNIMGRLPFRELTYPPKKTLHFWVDDFPFFPGGIC